MYIHTYVHTYIQTYKCIYSIYSVIVIHYTCGILPGVSKQARLEAPDLEAMAPEVRTTAGKLLFFLMLPGSPSEVRCPGAL